VLALRRTPSRRSHFSFPEKARHAFRMMSRYHPDAAKTTKVFPETALDIQTLKSRVLEGGASYYAGVVLCILSNDVNRAAASLALLVPRDRFAIVALRLETGLNLIDPCPWQ